MRTLYVREQDMWSGNLILVNESHPVRTESAATVRSLVAPSSDNPQLLMEAGASIMLSRLMHALNVGDSIVPVSGYRSMEEQTEIYEDSMRRNGQAFTMQYVAKPGHSEHQTGLAIDVAENKADIDFIRPDFPYTGICQAFRELAPKYGFIERYQAGKEAVTGIAHEPWHFRYVGYPHSELMRQYGLALEEYIDWLRGFPRDGLTLRFANRKTNYDISYIRRVPGTAPTAIDLHGANSYCLSGNNIDGFILTEWR